MLIHMLAVPNSSSRNVSGASESALMPKDQASTRRTGSATSIGSELLVRNGCAAAENTLHHFAYRSRRSLQARAHVV